MGPSREAVDGVQDSKTFTFHHNSLQTGHTSQSHLFNLRFCLALFYHSSLVSKISLCVCLFVCPSVLIISNMCTWFVCKYIIIYVCRCVCVCDLQCVSSITFIMSVCPILNHSNSSPWSKNGNVAKTKNKNKTKLTKCFTGNL